MPVAAPPDRERIYTPRVVGLFSATAAYFAVAGVSFPVLPRLVERQLNGSKSDIGLAFGVFAIGMLLARPLAGAACDRIGRRPVMIAGSLVLVVFQLLHVPAANTGHLWVLLVVRVATGAGASAMYLSQATVATELPKPQHRDQVFALFSTTILIGFAIGQVGGEIVMQQWGFSWAFAMAAAFAGLTTLIAMTLPETRPRDVVVASRVKELFHPGAVRIGVVNLLVFVAFMGFNAFIADYAEEFGLHEARWILFTYSITVLGMRAAGTKVFSRVPRRAVATFAHSTVVVGALLLATANGTGQLYVGAVVLAIGLAWNIPLLILIAVDSASDADRSRVVATVTTFGDLANSAGTLVLGFAADAFGYDGMYLIVAASAALAVVLVRTPFLSQMPGLTQNRVSLES